jgi:hypothetical protein
VTETEHQYRTETTGDETGNETVDTVLASLEQLDDLPAADHVAVFESAHDRLRAALSAAGEDQRG